MTIAVALLPTTVMNLVPLSNGRIQITRCDDGPTALLTCRWKDGDVTAEELDRIAEGCRLMAARIRGEWQFDADGVERTDGEVEDDFNSAAPPSADP